MFLSGHQQSVLMCRTSQQHFNPKANKWRFFCSLHLPLVALFLLVSLLLANWNASTARAQDQEKYRIYLSIITNNASPFSSVTGVPIEEPDWLTYINSMRALASLPPLALNAAWSDGAAKHARYMVKNDYIGHDEDPTNPWFTPEGRDAARSGNVLVSSNINMGVEEAIDMWMQGPFHALGILDPALRETGFGIYREAVGVRHFGATLDVLRGRSTVPDTISFPVMWPGDGATVHLTTFPGNEFPDPLSSCPGYTAPTGLPIIVQFGNGSTTPRVTASSFTQGTTELPHCVFDETTYNHPDPAFQSWGRNLLNSRDAVVIIPRAPLEPGATYTVTLTVNGTRLTWTFSVAEAGTKLPAPTTVVR